MSAQAKLARPETTAEELKDFECAVAVIAQHGDWAGASENYVKVTVRLDVRRPRAGIGSFDDGRRQGRSGGNVCESAAARLLKKGALHSRPRGRSVRKS